MSGDFINQLDNLYINYGYEARLRKNTKIYIFTKSIYNGADIIDIDENPNIQELKHEYSSLGYAVKVRVFKNIQEAEDILFNDFFKADGVISNLKRRYEHFVSKLMYNLPDHVDYEYIRSPFEYTEYKMDEDNNGRTIHITAEDETNNLVSKIVGQINTHQGPLLTIIEAAAGYGKTCTAYEILKEFISLPGTKLPFFTELSRDRQATIFKHILQFEIEEQFSNRVDSNVVIQQIKQGRIPLIIDGFDELITKDFSYSTNQFEQVESMLSTIIELLTDNAKIIITSRKTAIFNSEEFHNWMVDRDIDYTLAKVSILEPSIENWLPGERLEIVQSNEFPVEQLANPVLLTYLRYVQIDSLKLMMIENKSIVDSYFSFLLSREQVRQNLLIEPETQLRIFRKLVRFLTEWDVKAETKEFIKDIMISYNRKILEETRKKYTPDKRPRTDQLADILSNHAFLDRKEKGMIGMVNEFVLGTLVGENLLLGKYLQYNPKFYENISQMFALLAVQAFQVQPKDVKLKLWNVFNEHNFNYDPQFFFKIDLDFKNEISRIYENALLEGFSLRGVYFVKERQFIRAMFNDCIFVDCHFSLRAFEECSFVNCKFYNCELIGTDTYSDQYFTMYGCVDDNDFVGKVYESEEEEVYDYVNLENEILDLYFQKGTFKPRHRQLSHIKNELDDLDYKSVTKTIHKLKSEGIIILNGDLTHLTKRGIAYYNDNYKN